MGQTYKNVIYPITRMKGKCHMIISIHARKACDKIQHLFRLKKSKQQQKKGIERNYPNIIKAIPENPRKYYTQC